MYEVIWKSQTAVGFTFSMLCMATIHYKELVEQIIKKIIMKHAHSLGVTCEICLTYHLRIGDDTHSSTWLLKRLLRIDYLHNS